jgi:hypothetical protein
MVPRATAGLNSSPAVESQLINPPPSPTRIDSPDNAMSTLSNDSSNDIMNQLMDQLVHEVITNPALTPVGHALAQSALENNCIPVGEGMQTITCSLHFIRKWIMHLQLGLSLIEESSVDLHHKIQRSLGKVYSFVLMTCHLPCRISDSNDHRCSLCWAGPFIMNLAIIFFKLHPCYETSENK